MEIIQETVQKIQSRFGDEVLSVDEHAGQRYVSVKRDKILGILRCLRDECGFDMLADLCGVDYLNQGMWERYAVVYNLYSYRHNARFRVKAFLPEGDPSIDSAAELWRAAPWAEREAYDMYGFRFHGHPDLKRILLPEKYPHFPLRKDYPLQGCGERQDFPRYTKEEDGPSE